MTFKTLETVSSIFTAFLLVLGGLIIVTGDTSINAVVEAELFAAHIRASGVACPYAIANTLSLIVYLLMPETRTNRRITED